MPLCDVQSPSPFPFYLSVSPSEGCRAARECVSKRPLLPVQLPGHDFVAAALKRRRAGLVFFLFFFYLRSPPVIGSYPTVSRWRCQMKYLLYVWSFFLFFFFAANYMLSYLIPSIHGHWKKKPHWSKRQKNKTHLANKKHNVYTRV